MALVSVHWSFYLPNPDGFLYLPESSVWFFILLFYGVVFSRRETRKRLI